MNRRDRQLANALQALCVATRIVREARSTILKALVVPRPQHKAFRGYPEADVKAARRLMRLEP